VSILGRDLSVAGASLAIALMLGCSGGGQSGSTSTATTPMVAGSAVAPPVVDKPVTPIADRYRAVAEKIVRAALADDGGWKKLAYLTDRIGHRLSGSKRLEQAVAWSAEVMKADGHENVHTEKVMVPHWVRGAEAASMTAPTKHRLSILGLGGTVATPAGGLEAEVVVVTSFKDLAAKAASVKGKLVLYNTKMPKYDPEKGAGYGQTVKYRWAGPSIAARFGAVGVLMRSVTARSLRSPHTGSLGYDPKQPKIPAAAVTTEDADMIARLVANGQTVKVWLQLSGKYLPDAESANVVAELRGREKPEEIVLLACHLDSWDVGQGAHDDGAGCAIMMQTLTVLRRLKLRPRRTIRVVLFTNEENGGRGSKAYMEAHAAEVGKHVMAMEADTGAYAPIGMQVQSESARALPEVSDILSLTASFGGKRAKKGYGGADIGALAKHGVPALGLWMDGSKYFDIHHTHADTLDKVNPLHVRQNTAMVAVVTYVVADMEEPLGGPRKPAPPVETRTPTK
jgi:hypothetical protein